MKNFNNHKQFRWLEIVFLLLTSIFILFILLSHVDSLTIRKWDEARNAINALEMYQNGFDIVTTCHYRPDHWNTKPPLLIWIQTSFIHLFGINEFSVRLPSILAGFAIFIFLLWHKKSINFTIVQVCIATLMLFSFPFVIQPHCFRTGDYDALLTFFMLGYSIYYYKFIVDKKKEALLYFFIFLLLATMTKGIAALLFLPGLFLFTLLSKNLLKTLKQPRLYIGISGYLIVVLSYYCIRDHFDPGYIQFVIDNEMGSRFLQVKEDHSQSWMFYLMNLSTKGLGYFAYLLPVALILGKSSIKTYSFSIFSLLIIVTHIIILSFCQTKLYWYILPSLPLLAVIFSHSLSVLLKKYFPLILLLLLPAMITQVLEVIKTTNPKSESFQVANSIFLRDYDCEFDTILVIGKDYIEHTRFYEKKVREEQDCYVTFEKVQDVKKDDIILFSEESKITVEKTVRFQKLIQKNNYTVGRVIENIDN